MHRGLIITKAVRSKTFPVNVKGSLIREMCLAFGTYWMDILHPVWFEAEQQDDEQLEATFYPQNHTFIIAAVLWL